jgi:hypothetical protein
MTSLFGTAEFWFGALLLCAFQIAKFGEINPLAPDLRDRSSFPNLRASDFLGHRPYRGAVMAFVGVTLAGYVMLCLLSPSVIGGWVRITGQESEADAIQKMVQTTAYPLWIAAAFMGLAHQAIPGFSNLANIQRDAFHDMVGIPHNVAVTATVFSTRILAQSAASKPAMAERLALLCGDTWLADIQPIVDIGFLKAELQRLKLDGKDLEEALTGSSRELRTALDQVVYVTCIAAVRDGGRGALAALGAKLGITLPPVGPGSLHDLLPPALGSLAALTVLLFLIPMSEPAVAWLMGGSTWFWPSGNGAVASSAVYLVAQVIPVLIATAVLASSRAADAKGDNLLADSALAYLGIGALVVAYDVVQTLWDYGFNKFGFDLSTMTVLETTAPFILLHVLAVLAICAAIQWANARRPAITGLQRLHDVLFAVAVAAVVSAFHAWARINYQWSSPQPIDLLYITVILNMAAAAMGSVAYRSIRHRRQMRLQRGLPTGSAGPDPRPLPAE